MSWHNKMLGFIKRCFFTGAFLSILTGVMARTNETRHIKWQELCKCKCRLNGSACNDKHRWNDDKSRCKCKELIDKGVCDKGFLWNPSNCECECYKSCDFIKYLDNKNCNCRKEFVDKLTEECTENIDKVKVTRMALFEHENECECSYTICVVLAVIVFIISIRVGVYFVYSHCYLKNNVTHF